MTHEISEDPEMDIKNEFVEDVKSALQDRMESLNMRPNIELFPGEDDFAEWVACHERKARTAICNAPEFRDTPFCGTGAH
jgi:hypothetical protein